MSGEYGGCGKTSHLSVSKYFFTTLATWGRSIVMKKNNFIISLLVFRPFFSQCKWINCSRYQLYRIAHNRIARFQQLIVNKTLLVSPDTEHDLRTMNVRPWCWCWGRWQWLTGLSVIFFLLGVVVEYPLHISSHNPMQKIFSLLSLNQLFASEKSPFNVSRFQFISTQFPCFWIIPMLSIVQKRLVELPPMILQAPLAFDSDLIRVMPLILCLRIFLAVHSEACLQRWNLHPWNVETIPYMICQLEQCHHKLRQAFDGFQPHFSSN